MIANLIKLLNLEVYNMFIQDNPNVKKQRIFDELGMIELVTRMLEQIHMADFPPQT